jgi:hypothetical protein
LAPLRSAWVFLGDVSKNLPHSLFGSSVALIRRVGYRDSLAIMQRLVELDPSNAQWQNFLAWVMFVTELAIEEVQEAQRSQPKP